MDKPDFVAMSSTPPNRFPYSGGKLPVSTLTDWIMSGVKPAENTVCGFSQKETPLMNVFSAISFPRTCTKSSWLRIMLGAVIAIMSGRLFL